MTSPLRPLLTGFFIGLSARAVAQGKSLSLGGDWYSAGKNALVAEPVARDAYLAGFDVRLDAPVARDTHVAGFHVNADADMAGSLYAAGFSVVVGRPVGGDLSAAGYSITSLAPARVNGDARLAAANIVIGGPIAGSAEIKARTLMLDAAIDGDLDFVGDKLRFGPGALVAGRVHIRAPKPIAVPSSVAAADRVTYEPFLRKNEAARASRKSARLARSRSLSLNGSGHGRRNATLASRALPILAISAAVVAIGLVGERTHRARPH